ncbi:MAG: hypothetical protein AVDCRST_MAG89-4696, partial [uncultured Gemmatimonadetes bacterium]
WFNFPARLKASFTTFESRQARRRRPGRAAAMRGWLSAFGTGFSHRRGWRTAERGGCATAS